MLLISSAKPILKELTLLYPSDLGANFKAYCLATNLNCPWMYFYSTPFLNRIIVHNYISRTQIFAIHRSPILFSQHNEPYGHCSARVKLLWDLPVDSGSRFCDLSVQVMPSCSNITIHTAICLKSAC